MPIYSKKSKNSITSTPLLQICFRDELFETLTVNSINFHFFTSLHLPIVSFVFFIFLQSDVVLMVSWFRNPRNSPPVHVQRRQRKWVVFTENYARRCWFVPCYSSVIRNESGCWMGRLSEKWEPLSFVSFTVAGAGGVAENLSRLVSSLVSEHSFKRTARPEWAAVCRSLWGSGFMLQRKFNYAVWMCHLGVQSGCARALCYDHLCAHKEVVRSGRGCKSIRSSIIDLLRVWVVMWGPNADASTSSELLCGLWNSGFWSRGRKETAWAIKSDMDETTMKKGSSFEGVMEIYGWRNWKTEWQRDYLLGWPGTPVVNALVDNIVLQCYWIPQFCKNHSTIYLL